MLMRYFDVSNDVTLAALRGDQEKVQINTVITATVHRHSAVVFEFFRGILNIDHRLVTQ